MNKIILLDKTKGITSYDEIRKIKKMTSDKKIKIGHAGTLDPFASGLLIILLGHFTKLSDYLMQFNKTYEGIIEVGKQYNTGDNTGEVVATSENDLNGIGEELVTIYQDYHYQQIPPCYSAIKINGQKSYELARQQIAFSNLARPVYIKTFQIKKLAPKKYYFKAVVAKGTYIRTLVEDFLQSRQTVGTTIELRRLAQGPFNLLGKKELLFDDIINLLAIKIVTITSAMYQKVRYANTIRLEFSDEMVALVYEGKLVALYINNKTNYKPLFVVGEDN